MMKPSIPALILAAATLCLAPLAARAQPEADKWTFALTPYIWLPNVNGTLRYSPPAGTTGGPDVRTGPNDYLKNLSLALMLAGEARNGRWSILSDVIYLDFNKEQSNVSDVNFGGSRVTSSLNATTSSSLTGVQWLLATGYTIAQTPKASADLISGFRYLRIDASTNWQLSAAVTGPGGTQTFPAAGSASARAQIWDWIIGVRGRFGIGDTKWSAPYYVDVGAGSSSITWQGMIGIAYSFKWGDASLVYRHLYYDQTSGGLLQSFSFSGPALGATFRF